MRSPPIVQYGLLASQPRPRWRARTNSPVVLASSLPSAHRRPRVKARSPGWPGSSRSRTSACPCRSSDRTEGAHRAGCLRPWLRKPAKLRIEDSAAADTHSTRAKRGPGESPGRCWAPRPGRPRTHNGPVRATANARKAICRAALNRRSAREVCRASADVHAAPGALFSAVIRVFSSAASSSLVRCRVVARRPPVAAHGE